jgi:hypothetical protein
MILFFDDALATIEMILEKFNLLFTKKLYLISTRHINSMDPNKIKQLLLKRPDACKSKKLLSSTSKSVMQI